MSGLDADKWKISKHAARRALDMQITLDQILDLLEWPEQSRKSASRPGSRVLTKGEICATVAITEPGSPDVVTTFLWATQEAWDRDFSKTAQYLDRERRADAFGVQKHVTSSGGRHR